MSAEATQPVSNAPGSNESEPRGATVPVWLIVLLFLLLYWGAIYFDDKGGWFSAQVYTPYHNVEELQSYQISGPPDPRVFGLRVYNKPTCFSCHQANGRGQPGQFPPLAGSAWVNEAEPGRVIRIVLKGLTGPMTVEGQNFNGTMVAWGFPVSSGGLTDEEIAAVLTYVRQNKEWGNNAPAVTPERVAQVREKIKDHPAPYTADELLKISPAD